MGRKKWFIDSSGFRFRLPFQSSSAFRKRRPGQEAQAVSLFITDMLALSSVRRARPRVKTSQQDGENAG
jgi:hypothetical protein